jgi:NTE family protein
MSHRVTALALTGGGARAAYQVGCLRAISRARPEFAPSILTGVSAGAINAAHLACRSAGFAAAVEDLCGFWRSIDTELVFRVDAWSLASRFVGWGTRLLSGGVAPPMRGMVDTSPLREFLAARLPLEEGRLAGVRPAIDSGSLRALVITTTSYASGRSISWVQGDGVELWRRPQREAVHAEITLDHVMASAALPLFFPAVRIGREWHGDGGVRQTAPLSPAMHLGATHILAVSPRFTRGDEPNRALTLPYPSPARVAGILANAIFLDMLDFDALQMQRINSLLAHVPPGARGSLRPLQVLILRPSRDLGRVAAEHEYRLPRLFRFLQRGIGSRDGRSADVVSMVNFEPAFIEGLIELGESDTNARIDEITAFLEEEVARGT